MHTIDTLSVAYKGYVEQGYNPVEAGYAVASEFHENLSAETLEHVTEGVMTLTDGVPTVVKAQIAAPIDLAETYVGRHRDCCGPKVVPHVDESEPRRPGIPVPMMERDYLPPVAYNR